MPAGVTPLEAHRPASPPGPDRRGSGHRHAAIALAAVVTVVGGFWLALQSPVLAVRRVEVTGRLVHLDAETVRATAALRRGEPLLLADLGSADRRLERLSWVAEAQIERRLPGTVRIHVAERRPVAWTLDTGGAPRLVDGTGRVLGDAPAPPAGLPELRGLDAVGRPGDPVRPRRAATLLGALAPELGRYVGRVELRRRGVVLVLRAAPDGSVPPVGEVRLGTATDPSHQSKVAAAVLMAMTHRAGYLDVRAPDAPVTGGVG